MSELIESCDFSNLFKGQNQCGDNGFFSLFWDQYGTRYNLNTQGGHTAGGGYALAAIRQINTQLFNKYQRYSCRLAYTTNPYAATAINMMSIMTLGSGMIFNTPDEGKQEQIKEWEKTNKWSKRQVDWFKRYLTDGETFERKKPNGTSWCFVDPDFIYNSGDNNPNMRDGIIFDGIDFEEPIAFQVHKPTGDVDGKRVSNQDMVFTRNAQFGFVRGFSWLLPILTDLIECDKLSHNQMSRSELLSKIAFWRLHKANQASVTAFKGDIAASPGHSNSPNIPNQNLEHYPEKSIVDIPDTISIQEPNGELDFNAVLDASLRKIASHCHLPSSVFNDQQAGSHSLNSELISNSFIVRAIEAMQDMVKEHHLKILEMSGFDISDVSVVAPEVSVVDPTALIAEATFLLQSKLASRNTIADKFGIDFEAEQELIRADKEFEDEMGLNDQEENEPEKDIEVMALNEELDLSESTIDEEVNPYLLKNVHALGIKSKNKREYPISTMTKALEFYENTHVYVDHDDTNNRKYKDRIGSLKNPTIKENGIYCDLQLNPKHALADQILFDYKQNSKNVGLSHQVEGIIEKGICTEITKVRSVDLVCDPATTNSLKEQIEVDVIDKLGKEVAELKEQLKVMVNEIKTLKAEKPENYLPVYDVPSEEDKLTAFIQKLKGKK